MQNRYLPLLSTVLLLIPQLCMGDTISVKQDDGTTVSIDARWAGEGQGMVALERTDGRIEVVPQQQIIKRELGPDLEPISGAKMIERLTEQFGADKFRAVADAPYVVGLVLAEPLPKTYESKAADCLKKGAAFMKTVEKVFLEFVASLKIETVKPVFPLVLLIFETDDDFTRFTAEETAGSGRSAGRMLGYYSSLTNRLVIRMSECHTFATPLHEAVHQQVFNRGLIRRLSPVPVWFHEGIATGFEGNGEKVNSGPLKVNVRYARAAMRANIVNWDNVLTDDKVFGGDVLAGEAYANAWSIHWFLVTKYKKQYIEYLTVLGQKQPLEFDDKQIRIDDFERIFGKPIEKLQKEFPKELEQIARKQKVSLVETTTPGHSLWQINLAEVEVNTIKNGVGGELEAEGRMRNISHIRPMSFYITLETDRGTYAEWYLPNVAPLKTVPLPKQLLQKQMKGAPGGSANIIRAKVKTVIPDSESGKAWQRGQLPVPVWSGG